MPGIAVGVGERPAGCPFAPRCEQRQPHCEAELPPLEPAREGHEVRCFEWRKTPPVQWTPLVMRTRDADGAVALAVEGLRAEYHGRAGSVVAANDVSFELAQRGCVAIVGESGSGKTTIARSIAGLHKPSAGRILLDGQELPALAGKRTVEQRRRIQIIFQNPAEALNPRHTVAEAIARPAQILQRMSRSAAQDEVHRLLEAVRMPARSAQRYPGELSGGERQRVAIARALAAGPEVVVCDEITSALDVSVQAVVLELLRELRDDFGLSVVFISHDLGVVATIAEIVLVLENGTVCEQGPTGEVLGSPQHPYTQRLLQAAPSLSGAIEAWDVVASG